MSETDILTIAIAGYAAIVSTGALFLEVRRWFESGPRIQLSVMPEAILVGGLEADENTYLAITVTNVGTSPTTITHMILKQYSSNWKKAFDQSELSAIVPYAAPAGGAELPVKLDVGDVWHGQATYNADLAKRALSGKLYVGIASSHRSKNFLKKVRLSEDSKLGEKFDLAE